MPDGLALLPEGETVLIVVASAGFRDEIAHGEPAFDEDEVSPISGHPIEIDQAHVVGRTDGMAGQPEIRIGESPLEVVGCPDGDLKKLALSRGLEVHRRGGAEMSEVVHLELLRIMEWDGFRVSGVGPREACLDLDRSMQIAVGPLCSGNDGDGPVEALRECRVASLCKRRREGFQPFVGVAIIPIGAAMFSFGEPGGDGEVLQKLGPLRSFHDVIEGRYCSIDAGMKAVPPESGGPLHCGQWQRAHHCVRSHFFTEGRGH